MKRCPVAILVRKVHLTVELPERFGLGLTKYLAKNGVFWHF